MHTKYSLLTLMAVVGLATGSVACSDDGGGTEEDETSTGDGDGDMTGDGDGDMTGDGDGDPATGDGDGDPGGVDEAAIIAAAQNYEDWVLINTQPFQSAGHDGGNAVVNIWVPADVADQYKAIDPDAPQATTFAEGTIIVKEHVDENFEYMAATIMYKGPEGYSEASGDWWWGVGDLVGGELSMSGPDLEGCIGCHSAYPDTDWVVGVPADMQNP